MKHGDVLMIFVLSVLAAVWLWRRFKRWLHMPLGLRLPVPYDPPAETSEMLQLLEREGYEVLAGKRRIPIRIELDGRELNSRYFVDAFARDGSELYLVKVSRDRQPVSWTGSAIRDQWLPYFLIFEEAAGVLYVDMNQQKVRKMKISLDLEAGD